MTDLFSIRDAKPEDMALICTYAAQEGMAEIPGPEGIRVAVNSDDAVVAFCRLQKDFNGIAYVNPIVTYAPWRGYGVGRALIEDAHSIAGELRLISRGPSEGFYLKLGFEEMPWSDVDLEAASEDCDNCPDRELCGPVPMRLSADSSDD